MIEFKKFLTRWSGLILAWAICLSAISQAAAPLPADGPRLRLRFDADWRFLQIAEPARPELNLKWSSRKADATSLEGQTLPVDFDKGAWKNIELKEDVFDHKPGFAWFRADLGPQKPVKGLYIYITSVDEDCAVFLNGKFLGTHFGWSDPVEFPVASVLTPQGPNTLAVLVRNSGGRGGINAPVSLYFPPPSLPEKPAQAALKFDDASWRTVHLPHDYVIEGAFDPKQDNSHGSLAHPPAWYRKTFTLPKAYKGRSVWLDFDGVFRKSTVYLNGHKLGLWPSGYAPFRYDITRWANYGGRNVIAVYVDPQHTEGWWYEGGGIYRHVWLNTADKLHIAPWGVFVQSTPRVGNPMQPFDAPPADLKIQTEISNASAKPESGSLVSRVMDPASREVASLVSNFKIEPFTTATLTQTIVLQNSQLWSIEQPNLYRVETSLQRAGETADRQSNSFGIRAAYFDRDKGFFLNGRPVKIKGTCNHQDFAGTGIAMPDGLHNWRVKQLKKMGSNAYRFAHNAMAEELLDACDRRGMLVMAENRHLGDVESAKTPGGATATDLGELKAMVRRDRNHPSVIMWSMMNEEPLASTAEGTALFLAMRKAVLELDPTRPCTGAINREFRKGIPLVNDLLGFNYNIKEYDATRQAISKTPMFGSETGSAAATRNQYTTDTAAGHVPAYDQAAANWANKTQDAWKAIAERDWMAGCFVWTGFDYKGEPTPTGWPAIGSQFGIMDSCGFPKDAYYYYKAWWGDKPAVHVFPHWNWPGREGQPVSVWVYSAAEKVELFLNDKSLGVKPMPRFEHAEWNVPYEPGVLEARAINGHSIIAIDRVETTGAPAAIRLSPSRLSFAADQEDLLRIEAQVIDAQGRVVPTASNLLRFSVEGPARIVGVGNGDPACHEPDKAEQRQAFNGLGMALVGAATKPGIVNLTVTSPGLAPARIQLTALEALQGY